MAELINDLGIAVCVAFGSTIGVLLVLNVAFMLYRDMRMNELESPNGRPLLFHSPDDSPRTFKQRPFVKLCIGSVLLYSWVVLFSVGYIYMIVFCWLSYAPVFYAPTFALEAFGGWNGLLAPWLVIFTGIHIIALVLILTWDALSSRFMTPVDEMSSATHLMIEEDLPFQTDDQLVDPDLVPVTSVKRLKAQAVGLKERFKRAIARTVLPIVEEADGTKSVQYTCVRYVFSEEADTFLPTGIREFTAVDVHHEYRRGGLTIREAADTMAHCGANKIEVHVPGIMASLVKEFSDFTYVFNSIGTWSYMVYSSWNIGIFWLLLTVGSGMFRSLGVVRPNQKKIQQLAQLHAQCQVLRGGSWKKLDAAEIVLGDIVAVDDGDAKLPCDGIVIHGSLVVNESMLTGEPMPIQKMPVEDSQNASVTKKNVAYAGTACLQSVGPQGGKAVMIATAVGALTTRGQLVRMVLFPTTVRFKYNDQLPKVYGLLTVYMLILTAVYLSPLLDLKSWIATYLMVLNTIAMVLSPMLPVSMVMGQSVTATRLDGCHKINCLQPGRIPIAGKISTMVFDKTGTITKDGMDFDAVVSVEDGSFAREVRFDVDDGDGKAKDPDSSNQGIVHSQVPAKLRHALASCHTVTTLQDGTLIGNQVEVSMVNTVGWSISGNTLRSPSTTEALDVIKKLDFDHCRMTSGVVVRHAGTGEVDVFVKGSYEKIQSISLKGSVPGDYDAKTQRFAKEGYYVLGIATKSLPAGIAPQEVADLTRDSLESGLHICGLLLFRNEMKRDSRQAIKDLRKGAIRSVICTGDNALTGLSIGRQCSIVSRRRPVLLGELAPAGGIAWRNPDIEEDAAAIPAHPLGPDHEECQIAVTQGAWRHLHSHPEELAQIWTRIVVFARMKPEDKINVVKYFQSRNLVTGMCGDGGNDCGGLRAAHAGLALSDAEASMVSPFSTGRDGKSLITVVDLIREGRACLATNIATFQYFLVYAFTLTTIRTALVVYAQLSLGEYVWLTMDVGIGMIMVWTMTQSRPTKRLAAYRPTATLLGPRTLSAIAFPYFSALVALVVGLGLLWGTDWYVRLRPLDDLHLLPSQWMLRGDNYDSAVGMLVLVLALVNTAYVNTYGGSFRRNILFNYGINFVYSCFLFGLFWLLLSPPTQYNCVYRVGCDTRRSLDAHSLTVLAAFSAGGVGGCFLGPQVKVWQDEMAEQGWGSGFASGPQYWLPTKANGCEPPEGYTATNVTSPEISQFGCVGSNNCYSWNFKWQMAMVLILYMIINHLFTKVVLQGAVADRLRAVQRKRDARLYDNAPDESDDESDEEDSDTHESPLSDSTDANLIRSHRSSSSRSLRAAA